MAVVVVIEPHALLRFGILTHLTDVLPELHIRGVDYSSLFEHAPDNVKSDLVLLSGASHEAITELTQAALRTYAPKRMLLSSDTATMPNSWQDLPTMVAGYVSKNASPAVLAASISLALVGGTCFQPSPYYSTPVALKHEFPRMDENQESIRALQPPLANTEAHMLGVTARQYEVLVLLAHGHPIKTVSRRLNISTATAKAHTESLYQRLGVHSRNQAVYIAISRGATLGWKLPAPDNLKELACTMTT